LPANSFQIFGIVLILHELNVADRLFTWWLSAEIRIGDSSLLIRCENSEIQRAFALLDRAALDGVGIDHCSSYIAGV